MNSGRFERPTPSQLEVRAPAPQETGFAFMWKPVLLGVVLLFVMVPLFRWARAPRRAAGSDDQPVAERPLADLPGVDSGGVGLLGARSQPTSVVGKLGDTLSARARVLNVFRMKKSLVAVTEASVFIHAMVADGLPEWVQPGKNVQIEGRIIDVKTKTNVHVNATKLTAMP